MACLGRFYVLGPPTQSGHDVTDLVSSVMRQTADLGSAPFTLRDLEGPVRYDSSWVPGGRRNVLRQGLEVAELWTGQVSWHDPALARSFSVIVMDQEYLEHSHGHRRNVPGFETFVVGVLQGDKQGVSRVYEWRTSPERTWRYRGLWLMPLGDDSDRHRRQAVDALGSGSWQLLHDLECLFTAPDAARASRRARRGRATHVWGCHEALRPPRLDVILPFGLDKFLTSLVQRPRSFEQLCRALWEMERSGREHASMPGWYRDTCASSLVASSEHLQQWWWANIMGAAGSAVQQLLACVDRERPTVAVAVRGLSFRHYRTLGRNPVVSVDHTTLIDECKNAGISLGLMDLGTGEKSIVRGVCTGGYIPCASADADGDEDYSISSQAQRLVQVTWTLVQDERSNMRQAQDDASVSQAFHRTSMHYITKFDTAKRWFLFEEDVIVTYPEHMRFDISVVFGPWAGHGRRFFELAGDRSKATAAAAEVSQVLPVRGMLQRLLPASALAPGEAPHEGAGVYLALGGPGVGKTSGRVVECIQDVCRQGKKRALLVSSLCKVRNLHVAMLRSALDESVFCEQVRVVGSSGLDELARSRTLPALVRQRMAPVVAAHEDRLTKLDEAASHVAALGALALRFGKLVVDIIDSFGGFKITLATMHRVVAAERCALEAHVSIVEHNIICSTRVLVSTVGSLLRQSARREVCSEAGVLSFVLGDEGTRTLKFEFDMLMASLGSVVDKDTRLGLVGDPCQLKTVLRTLKCTSSLHVACGLNLSAVGWILDLLIAEKPAPIDFVARVDLLNRYKASQRCRALACQAVNKLAPMCLPGTRNFWKVAVDGQEVWSDLRPNSSMTPFEVFLSLKTSEVVSVLPMHWPARPTTNVAMSGYHGKSRYDVDVALYAAMAAVVVGVQQLRLRRTYDLAEWSTHFASEEAATMWARGRVRVTIIAAYTAMVDLTREAVRFVQGLHPSSEYIMGAGDDRIEICCASADAVQGETFDYMVLALPASTSQWSEWLCDPSRLLTIMSRYRWQLAMTYVLDDGISAHAHSFRDSVKVALDLQKNADTSWTWESMLETLGWSVDNGDQLWGPWMKVVQTFSRSSTASESVSTEPVKTWSAATASTARTPIFSTPICYRGHRLLLLRYMRSLLRLKQHDPDVHTWVREVRCDVSEKRSLVGLRMHSRAAEWLERELMTQVRDWHAHTFGMDGTLLSLMTEPIGNGSAQLFSAVVYGIGCRHVSMWSLGRMEWLALELVAEARQVLLGRMGNEDDALWSVLEQKLQRPRSVVDLSIAFAPHKMRMLGDELEASAPGAGERADVLLLAWPMDAEEPSVLGWAYHTTNVPPGTASMRRGQAYPESRVLWRHCAPLPDLIKLAACSLAERLGLPPPASVDSLLDAGVWSTGVMSQGAVPVGVPDEGHDSGEDFDSDSEH